MKQLDGLRQSVDKYYRKRSKKVARYMQHYKPVKTVEEQYRHKNQALKDTVKKREISVE
jgi:hypothetical protein